MLRRLDKIFLVAFSALFLFFVDQAFAISIVKDVRAAEYDSLVRVVLDIHGEVNYSWERQGNYIQIKLPDTIFVDDIIPPLVDHIDVLDRVEVKQLPDGARVYIYLDHPSYSELYPLSSPNKLVIDLRKDLKEFSRWKVSDGMEFVRVALSGKGGPVVGSMLKIEPSRFDVIPALAAEIKREPDFAESFFSFFRPVFFWIGDEPSHFFREKTSSIAKRENAVAAVNGTYFGRAGEPLGILMIDGDLITFPIYERTALVISDTGRPAIDKILLSSYFSITGGVRIEVDGFNERRASKNEVTVYTSRYGEKTGTRNCFEVVVRQGKVAEIRGDNSEIPADGYVLSVGKETEDLVRKYVKPGDAIGLKVELIPYSINGDIKIKHIVGGGPRLIKAGRIYVSKKEERFKWDIATTRAARTAVGITKDGQLLFVTIDKTSRIKSQNGIAPSSGMKLEELSEFLLSLDVVEAMNLDGGGSSTMVVSGEVMNLPANGHEIAISNVILIKGKD